MTQALFSDNGWSGAAGRLPVGFDLAATAFEHGAFVRARGVRSAEDLLRGGNGDIPHFPGYGLEMRNVPIIGLPSHRVHDGINAARMLLPRCWFDAEKFARGPTR